VIDQPSLPIDLDQKPFVGRMRGLSLSNTSCINAVDATEQRCRDLVR